MDRETTEVYDPDAHARPIEDLVGIVRTHLTLGLSDEEVSARLAQYGPNELQERPRPTFWHLLLGQFNNFLVIILLASAIISLFLGEYLDASAIMAIVVLNAVLGVVQESKAEEVLAALKKMAAPEARVIRSGHIRTVPAREIVPGDVVKLEAGHYVPADVRLVEAVNLKIDKASLTGESVPVQKDATVVLDQEIPLGDRRNSAFPVIPRASVSPWTRLAAILLGTFGNPWKQRFSRSGNRCPVFLPVWIASDSASLSDSGPGMEQSDSRDADPAAAADYGPNSSASWTSERCPRKSVDLYGGNGPGSARRAGDAGASTCLKPEYLLVETGGQLGDCGDFDRLDENVAFFPSNPFLPVL